VYFGITCPLYGISLFLPSIIKDLGYTSSTAQLLTVSFLSPFFETCPNNTKQVPIYITAAIVAVIAAYVSDRRKQRSPFILFFMGMIGIGFVICIASVGRGVPGVMYFGIFVAVVGKYIQATDPVCLYTQTNAKPNRDLSCLPRKRHLAQCQHGRRLQASRWHGHLHWYRKLGRR
jgi:MFS family permease